MSEDTQAKKKEYMKLLAQWVKDSDLKVGDSVLVKRKAFYMENGWDDAWIPDMNDMIGKEVKISAINSRMVQVATDFSIRNVPYFVLEKVNKNAIDHYSFDSKKDENAVVIERVEVVYSQSPDCSQENQDEEQRMKLFTENEGAGAYAVIETKRWALDNIEQLASIYKDFAKRAGLKEEQDGE